MVGALPPILSFAPYLGCLLSFHTQLIDSQALSVNFLGFDTLNFPLSVAGQTL